MSSVGSFVPPRTSRVLLFENKHHLLEPFAILNQVMLRITQFVSTLTPYGVFAVTASAAGTMSVEEFERLQVYLVMYMSPSPPAHAVGLSHAHHQSHTLHL